MGRRSSLICSTFFYGINKIARVIAQLANTLNVSNDRVLAIFYDSEVCKMLHNPEFGLHLMSDTYIVNDLIEELRMKQ